MLTWVLILHWGSYSGVAPQIAGYPTREDCMTAGEQFRKDYNKYATVYCVQGPRR